MNRLFVFIYFQYAKIKKNQSKQLFLQLYNKNFNNANIFLLITHIISFDYEDLIMFF